MKISERFQLGRKLGQGTFSYIYEAYDKNLKQNVALKIEKKDKNKSILIFEYSVLNMLKGLQHVCNAYDFVKNSEQNLIVMDLLGNNLAKVRKCLEDNYSLKIAVQLLIEMLDAIEEVHDRGFIHRDVKASNFVLSRDNKQVFIVDFGLAKKHLDDKKEPMAQRKKADFRGTVSFASLNAHNNIDLARRDDLWSLYFVILDFLNEKLKWREQKEYTMDEVKHIKTDCLNNPEEKLWIVTKDVPEVKTIFYHLKALKYEDVPDYALIRGQLKSILERNTEIPANFISNIPPPAQFINQQRVPGQGMPPIYIPTQQPPFTVYQHPYAQRAIGYPQPTVQQPQNQEFQTPERPQNHHRLINSNAAQLINQQHQVSQQLGAQLAQDNLSMQDDGAFPKASPHHLLNVSANSSNSQQSSILQNCNISNNLAQQYFQTSVQQRKTGDNNQVYNTSTGGVQQQQIRDANQQGLMFNQSIQFGACAQNNQNPLQEPQDRKRADLKRKHINTSLEQVVRHEQNQANDNNQMGNNLILGSIIDVNNGPAQSQNKRVKQVTKQEKKCGAASQSTSRKKDNKKQNQTQIKIIPDEEPLQVKTILENAQNNDLQVNGGGKIQQNLAVPSGNNLPIFQFSPSNASNVNQQISISQNFYLSPHFLLLLNDHPENTNQILQQAALAQANGQQYALPPGSIPTHTRPQPGLIGGSNLQTNFNSNNPELIHSQGLVPININNNTNNLYNKVPNAPTQTFTQQQAGLQPLNQGDTALYNYGTKYQKTNLQTLETLTDTKIKEEQLDGNNLQNNKNTIIQIMQQQPNASSFLQTQIRATTGNLQNQQNTFYDILSQGNARQQYKGSQQAKKSHPPLPPGSNSYYYDPNLIEKHNIPCFRVEKITKRQNTTGTGLCPTATMTSVQIKQNTNVHSPTPHLVAQNLQQQSQQQQQIFAQHSSLTPALSQNLMINGTSLKKQNQSFNQITFTQSLQTIPSQVSTTTHQGLMNHNSNLKL